VLSPIIAISLRSHAAAHPAMPLCGTAHARALMAPSKVFRAEAIVIVARTR
jgi:hypothetical protein